MSWIAAIVLGVVQGVTECLPVSSSGHLVIAERLMGISSPGVALEAILHLGTLAAAVLFFRARWIAILRHPFSPDSLRSVGFIVLGTLPAAAAGLLLHERLAGEFHNLRPLGRNFIVCGAFLILIPHLRLRVVHGRNFLICGAFLVLAGRARRGDGQAGWGRALVVGLAQAAALLPGISRSGMTTGTGLLTGMRGDRAVEFSFLLAVPAILGAVIVELPRMGGATGEYGLLPLALAAAAAFASGYAAIGALLRWVERGRLGMFGYYCFFAGAVCLLWS